jgi:hypothetical protein
MDATDDDDDENNNDMTTTNNFSPLITLLFRLSDILMHQAACVSRIYLSLFPLLSLLLPPPPTRSTRSFEFNESQFRSFIIEFIFLTFMCALNYLFSHINSRAGFSTLALSLKLRAAAAASHFLSKLCI